MSAFHWSQNLRRSSLSRVPFVKFFNRINSSPTTKRSTFFSVSFLFVYTISTTCPSFSSSDFIPSANFTFSSATPNSCAFALVLASCKIESVNECSLPYRDSAALRFLFDMAGVSMMMGRMIGTIHLVRKGDDTFSVPPVSRSNAPGRMSSLSRTLATLTVHPSSSV